MLRLHQGSADEPEPFDELAADEDFQSRASHSGYEFKFIAADRLADAGATFVERSTKHGPYPVDFVIEGPNGRRYLVLAHGVPDDTKTAGLRRPDTVKKLGFDVMQLARQQSLPILAVTSHLPYPNTAPAKYLADLTDDLFDVIAVTDDFPGYRRLLNHLQGDGRTPTDAPWRTSIPTQLGIFRGAPNPVHDFGPEEPF